MCSPFNLTAVKQKEANSHLLFFVRNYFFFSLVKSQSLIKNKKNITKYLVVFTFETYQTYTRAFFPNAFFWPIAGYPRLSGSVCWAVPGSPTLTGNWHTARTFM